MRVRRVQMACVPLSAAPSSTLPLLTGLQIQPHLVTVWESCVVFHNAGEPPSAAGLVISSFTGDKLIPVGSALMLLDLSAAEVGVEFASWGWERHFLSQSGTGFPLEYPHSRRIFKCISWVGCKHKLRCFPKQNSSLGLCLFWARVCELVWTRLKRTSAAGVIERHSFFLNSWVQLRVQVTSHSIGRLVWIWVWCKRNLNACCV